MSQFGQITDSIVMWDNETSEFARPSWTPIICKVWAIIVSVSTVNVWYLSLLIGYFCQSVAYEWFFLLIFFCFSEPSSKIVCFVVTLFNSIWFCLCVEFRFRYHSFPVDGKWIINQHLGLVSQASNQKQKHIFKTVLMGGGKTKNLSIGVAETLNSLPKLLPEETTLCNFFLFFSWCSWSFRFHIDMYTLSSPPPPLPNDLHVKHRKTEKRSAGGHSGAC